MTFVNDENGQVIQRDENDALSGGDPRTVYYRFGGRQLGEISNNGTDNIAYDASIDQYGITPPTTPGAFRGGATTSTDLAAFGQAYDAINSFGQSSAQGGPYVVQGGESLQSIAAQRWGDAGLWYRLAQANGLAGGEALIAGQTLNIPGNVVRSSNNANTFKAYDPSAATGDISPTAPQPPKNNKCGVFGQILLAVIAVAVSLVLTPAAGATFGQVLLGAVAGNVASQAVGVATGIQEKFSFKGLALAAISAGVTAGVGSVVNGAVAGSKFLGDVARGALSSGISQGVGVATGLQSKFNWAGVAAAGIGAGIGGAVGRGINGQSFLGQTINQGDFGHTLATATASGIANAATRSAINSESFGRNFVAALPDIVAQAIGSAIGGGIRDRIDRANEAALQESAHSSGAVAAAQATTAVPIQQPGEQVTAQPTQASSETNMQGLAVVASITGTRQETATSAFAQTSQPDSVAALLRPGLEGEWQARGDGVNASFASDGSGEIVVTAKAARRGFGYRLADTLGFHEGGGVYNLFNGGVNRHAMSGFDLTVGRASPTGQYLTQGQPDSVWSNVRNGVRQRRQEAYAQWNAGGLGYVAAPINWVFSGVAGMSDVASSYYRGRGGWVAPADRQSTDISLFAVGSIGTMSSKVGRLGSAGTAKGAPLIADDAFVRFDPSVFDDSIKAGGIQSRYFSDGKVWLAKYGDIKGITNASDLDTILYRKNLWPATQGKFDGGATLRVIDNVNGAIPSGVTNMTDGVRQWHITRDIAPQEASVLYRIQGKR